MIGYEFKKTQEKYSFTDKNRIHASGRNIVTVTHDHCVCTSLYIYLVHRKHGTIIIFTDRSPTPWSGVGPPLKPRARNSVRV